MSDDIPFAGMPDLPPDTRIADLEAQLATANRIATDRLYLMEAYRQMLGPKGLLVAKMWFDRRVKRVHHSWGPEAHLLSGEERAQAILDMEAAMKDARRVDYVDGDPIQAERREAAGKVGDENAPQTQGAEIDPRRLPDVQTP